MKKINREDNMLEFYDNKEALFIISGEDSISFYFVNVPEKNYITITNEDSILFNAFNELYNDVKKMVDLKSRLDMTSYSYSDKNKIFKNRQIEIHSSKNDFDKANILYINKVSDKEFKLVFDIKNKDDMAVTLDHNILNGNSYYTPYDIFFRKLFYNLYTAKIDDNDESKRMR